MPFVAELDADVLEALLLLARDRGTTIDHAVNEILRTGINQITEQQGPRSPAIARSNEWYKMIVDSDVSLRSPGLYTWIIDDEVVFIGYFTKISTATTAYENHVRRLASVQGSQQSEQKDVRPIHHTLLRAKIQKRDIVLHIFENGATDDLKERCNQLRRLQNL